MTLGRSRANVGGDGGQGMVGGVEVKGKTDCDGGEDEHLALDLTLGLCTKT